jgi:hypothetical protein
LEKESPFGEGAKSNTRGRVCSPESSSVDRAIHLHV